MSIPLTDIQTSICVPLEVPNMWSRKTPLNKEGLAQAFLPPKAEIKLLPHPLIPQWWQY